MAKRRRGRRRRSKGWGLALLFLSVLGLALLLKVGFPPGPREEVAKGEWYQVFFTRPGFGIRVQGPEVHLADLINRAKERAWLAFYEVDNPKVVEALLNARKRGVDVRVITEAERAGWGVKKLRAGGVPVVLDKNRALMHDKFAVVDEEWVWTGSYNLTESGARLNYDNAAILASKALNRNFAAEFSEMWRGLFGAGSPRNTQRLLRVGGVFVECYFAPEDHPSKRIAELIDGAKKTIDIAMYSFTSKGILRALSRAKGRGVAIRVVMDDRQAENKYSVDELLIRAGIPVVMDGPRTTMHHKFMVVDSEVVVFGSYNFTKSADKRNDENLLVIHSPEMAKIYLGEMDRLWALGRPLSYLGWTEKKYARSRSRVSPSP